MTVAELSARMDSAELSEWIAYDNYFEPLPRSWEQTGLLASAVLAPHCEKHKTPKAEDFIPRARLQQTPEELQAELAKLKKIKEGK